MLRLAAFAAVLVGAAARDPCECLNWKELYDSGRAKCGEGRELGSPNMTWPMGALEYGLETLNKDYAYQFVCQGVYMKLDNNYCANYNLHKYGWTAEDLHPSTAWHGADRPEWRGLEQWCYVSSECNDEMVVKEKPIKDKDSVATWPKLLGPLLRPWFYDFVAKYLHFPRKIRRDIAVKVCKKGKDKRLWDMNPLELMKMGVKSNMRVGTLTKVAYAVARDSGQVIETKFYPLWETVAPHVKNHSMRDLPWMVKKAVVDKACIVLDVCPFRTDDTQRIICGNELYKLNSECKGPGMKMPDNHCILKLDAKYWTNFSRGEDIPWTDP